MENQLLSAFAGYLFGSIPFGLILSRFFGHVDLRKIGSGNIGATNVLRTGKKHLAALTLFLDVMKAVFAIFLVEYWTHGDFNSMCLTGGFALLGHCFPIWLKFKGGKGVATGAGILLALHPLVGVITISVWLSVIFLTRISSLGALVAVFTTPVSVFFLSGNKSLLFMTLFLTAIVVFRHKENIKRLFAGTEPKIGK